MFTEIALIFYLPNNLEHTVVTAPFFTNFCHSQMTVLVLTLNLKLNENILYCKSQEALGWWKGGSGAFAGYYFKKVD